MKIGFYVAEFFGCCCERDMLYVLYYFEALNFDSFNSFMDFGGDWIERHT